MRGIAVARDVEVIEFERKFEQRQQLSCEYHAAAHDTQHQRIAILKSAADVERDALNRRGDRTRRAKLFRQIEDLPSLVSGELQRIT
ncbi:hypothetical protein D3C83_61090 [compost metagenome]